MSLEQSGTGSPSTEQPLVRFGDIVMTEHWLMTPQGTVPLAGTQIYITDQTRVDRVTPTWAIVLAIVGFFVVFLFSLLFLLARDNRVSGFMQITVVNGSFTYQSAEPVGYNPAAQLYELQNRANYARGLIARAA
ncbi:hypothetical protein [Herbiconiux solani]|uniref:hypothetical protein n=1 Tax=Herbiconiux solani TaxID=661329 RepID=UPI0008266E02|nr:hypothetical protein [Herbiconiux solani]